MQKPDETGVYCLFSVDTIFICTYGQTHYILYSYITCIKYTYSHVIHTTYKIYNTCILYLSVLIIKNELYNISNIEYNF